jgi:hypothetical protein
LKHRNFATGIGCHGSANRRLWKRPALNRIGSGDIMKVWMASILAMAGLLFPVAGASGQPSDSPAGTITGTITADKGPVAAVRVKAIDASRKMAYVVFSNKGRYHIFNLPPGSYQVTVLEDNFASNAPSIELKAGETATADLALIARNAAQKLEFVDFNVLYPPGPGRELLLQNCLGCHSIEHIPFHRMPPKNEEGWRKAVNIMFGPSPRSKVAVVSPESVSAEQREIIVKYLAANFGENSKPLDMKRSPVPLDEEALSRAIYVQYDLDPPISLQENTTFASKTSPMIWMVGAKRQNLVSINLTDPLHAVAKNWPIPQAAGDPGAAYAISGSMGRIYWCDLAKSAMGELNPESGEMHEYDLPTLGSPHTSDVDSKGNIWFSEMYSSNKIGRLDPRTKKITEWVPAPKFQSASFYGLVVDQKDRVWAVGISSHIVVGYDPRTDQWTTYPTPTQPSGPRRVTVDSKGKVWFTESIGDALGMLDPDTGKITEYRVPMPRAGEHGVQSDLRDNIWVSLRAYNVLARFDQRAKKFSYFPYPVPGGHSSKLEIDGQGNLVLQVSGECRGSCSQGPQYPRTVSILKPNGNVSNSTRARN